MNNKVSISEIIIHIDGDFQKYNLKTLSKSYLSIVEEYAGKRIGQLSPIYEISLVDGSLKVRTKIFIAVAFLTQYGSIRSGIEFVGNDVKWINEKIVSTIKQISQRDGNTISYYRSFEGDIGRIKSLFIKVENGELTSDQAFDKAKNILKGNKFDQQLRNEFKRIERYQTNTNYENQKAFTDFSGKKSRTPIEKSKNKLFYMNYDKIRKPRSIVITKDTNTGKITIKED